MSSKKTFDGADKIYTAADEWVKRALRSDDSLFTPGKSIWSRELLSELHIRFLDRPDESSRSFLVKLQEQLADSSHEVYQLMAEVLYVHFLHIWRTTMGKNAKVERINQVLEWSDVTIAMPDHLYDALTHGIAASMSFNLLRPYHVGFLIEFVEQWKAQSQDKRASLLNDPWAFKDFVTGMSFSSLLLTNNRDTPNTQREALLHLVFPDDFEGIVSSVWKSKIANADAFARFVTEPIDDVDRKIQQIRQGLERELGRDFDFYDIRNRWQNGSQSENDEPSTKSDDSHEEDDKHTLTLADLANDLTLPIEFLQETQTLLDDKQQVIFQGPPGTGKTYVARELAAFLAGSKERVTLVQFHPTYSYEDFVRGYRPTLVNGQAGFTLRDGPLVRAANAANRDKDTKHFLIIDEINRGNLAGVFGELYFLLEYRDEEISLQYSEEDEKFSLPDNLYIIGTMNTADRSIALVDLALRRRFYFVEFHPDDEPIDGLLRRWLHTNGLGGMDWVANVVDRANELLRDDRHAAIGPSYFMKDDLDEAAVERIWKHSVLPYIEERLFGQDGRLGEFQLDMLRGRAQDDSGNAENEATVASESDTESDSGGE